MRKSFICEKDSIYLLEFLSDMLGFLPREKLKKQLILKEIKVNSKKVSENIALKRGDEVSIFLPRELDKADESVDIIYSDSNIVVVDKPVLCDVENHLITLLKKSYPNIKAVHRLDRNTRGVVVFALSDEAYNELNTAFKSRNVEKYYSARVFGVVKKDKDLLKAYIKKDPKKNLSVVSAEKKEGYSEILTGYEVIQRMEDSTLLKIHLLTGKTHQIRAHLAFIGHPIIGDSKYGSNAVNKASGERYQCLYAEKITFHGLKDKFSYLNGLEFKRKNID